MLPVYEIPKVTASHATAPEIEADLVAIPIPHAPPSNLDWFDQATSGELSAAFKRGEFTGKACELWTPSSVSETWRTRRVLAVGTGATEITPEGARRVGACVGLIARQQRRARLAFIVTHPWSDLALEALIEGVAFANFETGQYKSRHDGRFFLSTTEIALADRGRDVSGAIERAIRVGDAVNAARVLINEPGNRLTPREFADRGLALLSVADVSVEILDEQQIEELRMGLLLGVARGSAEPPRLLVARYEPADAPASPVLALVGKGITFDTGGISLKPADGMERMKDDMAGGAAVIAALRAIALERLRLRAMVVVPATENMPGGRATRPGDILRSASGLTVEVNNTDAEGRLILGDALWYARELGATHVVDVATLTGACVVALGKTTTGLFGTDGWTDQIRAAAERSGEKVWTMPLFDDYREQLKSEIADLLNSPGRPAGAITAAMFLKEFVGATPWAHLDIAGTAWNEDARAWLPKGATGVMIPTLVALARSLGKNWP